MGFSPLKLHRFPPLMKSIIAFYRNLSAILRKTKAGCQGEKKRKKISANLRASAVHLYLEARDNHVDSYT